MYERFMLPYLMDIKCKTDELWLIGKDSKALVIHSGFASTILKTVAGAGSCVPSNCILVPEAPLEVLQHFSQLLHTGRYYLEYWSKVNWKWNISVESNHFCNYFFSNQHQGYPQQQCQGMGYSPDEHLDWSRRLLLDIHPHIWFGWRAAGICHQSLSGFSHSQASTCFWSPSFQIATNHHICSWPGTLA